MAIGLLADLHLHPHSNHSHVLPTGRNSRLQHGVDCFKQVIDNLAKKDVIVFLGDFFENWEDIPVDCIDAAKEILNYAKVNGVSLVLLTGNHDQFSRDGMVHSMGLFNQREKDWFSTVIDRPCVHSFTHGKDKKEFTATYLPYRDEEYLLAARDQLCAEVGTNKVMPLFCHIDYKGAIANSGRSSERGINFDFFPAWVTCVFSGHYHRHQVINSFFCYVGSPYQITAGEEGEEKVWLKYRSGTFSIGNTEAVSFVGIPEFKTTDLDSWRSLSHEEQELAKQHYHLKVAIPPGLTAAEKSDVVGVRTKLTDDPSVHDLIDDSVVIPETHGDALRLWLQARDREDLVERGLAYLHLSG